MRLFRKGNAFLAAALAPCAFFPGRSPGTEEPLPEEPGKLRELVAVYVADLERGLVKTEGEGLRLSAVYLPDALTYLIASEYLSRLKAGEEHDAAVRGIASLLPSWKKRQGMAAVRLKIENLEPRPRRPVNTRAASPTRVYTIQGDLPGEVLVLTGEKNKPLSAQLAEPPRNLRPAQLRVKKFWTTANGAGRSGASDPDDPLSIGRKPKLSSPFSAFLVEEKPVEAELLLKPRRARELPHLSLKGLKRYEGPFAEGLLDLNGGRRWDPVPALELDLIAPPAGLETPKALVRLAEEARALARAK